MSALTQRFDDLCRRLVRAAECSGRSGDSVRLVAVSKFQPALSVAELARHWAEQGRTPVFGESYVQEAEAKRLQVAELAPGLNARWHFIGHLQSRKAKDVIGRFDLIHSVDSLKSAAALDRAWRNRQADASEDSGASDVPTRFEAAGTNKKQEDSADRRAGKNAETARKENLPLPVGAERPSSERPPSSDRFYDPAGSCEGERSGAPFPQCGSRPQDILIQVNIGREPQKSGAAPEELEELLASILALPGLRPLGLMCLPPFAEEPEKARPWFIRLCALRDEMQKIFKRPLPHLSMGMSGDFEAAVEEGATLVRVGTDIFGARN